MTAPLHVGIDATCWTNDRGYGRFTRELVTALAKCKGEAFRYTLVFDRAPETPVPPGVEVLVAGAKGGAAVGSDARSPAYVFQLGALAGRAKFDVFFYPAMYSFFPLLAKTPCVVCYHDTIPERFPELIFPTKLNRRLWQAKTFLAKLQTKRAMTISESSARDIESMLHIPRDKIDVITEGAGPAFKVVKSAALKAAAREAAGIDPKAPLLVYVGGFNRHKNVARLLEACKIALKHRPFQLALVGDTSGGGFWDNVDELMATVENHPALAEAVRFPGYLDDETLAALLSSAEALVFPSLAEGFGLPAVEAMACGAPVLAADRLSLPEVVGDAGLLFDPENVEAMAGVIERFLADPQLRARARAAALERTGLFSWDRAAGLAEVSFRKAAL